MLSPFNILLNSIKVPLLTLGETILALKSLKSSFCSLISILELKLIFCLVSLIVRSIKLIARLLINQLIQRHVMLALILLKYGFNCFIFLKFSSESFSSFFFKLLVCGREVFHRVWIENYEIIYGILKGVSL